MDKLNWDNKQWLKDILTKQGAEVKVESGKEKRKMVYYTSLPLIMQHNADHSGSSQGCGSSVSPPIGAGSLQIGLPHPHSHHQPQIINLSNNITLQAVSEAPQFAQHHPSLGHEVIHNKLSGIDYSLPRNIDSIQAVAQQPSQQQQQQAVKNTKFKCEQCNMCFGSKSAHTSHMKSHAKQQQYQLSPASSGPASPLDLVNGPMARPNDQYQCDVCKKTFAVPARLIRHYRTHTGERPFECEFCHKMFSVKENLQVHRRIHTKERPYKCTVCERAFEHSGKLHRHMRIHTGERPHKCNVCGKTFIQSGQLVIHMRTHTGEKPYKCPEPGCGKGFTCSKQLKVHSRTHTGEKPYQCDICFRDFGYNHVLKLHRVQHYGAKCYKCTICDETFKNKKEMEAHIKGHANDMPDDESRSSPVQKVERFSPDHQIVPTPDVAKEEEAPVDEDAYNYRLYPRFDSHVTSQYAVQSSMNPVALLAAASIVASAQERAVSEDRPPSNAPSLSPVSLSPSSYSSSSFDLSKMRQTYFHPMAPTPEFKSTLQSSEELVKRVEAALGCTTAEVPETPPRSSPEDERSSSPESDSPHMSDHRDNNTLPPRKRRLYFLKEAASQEDASSTPRVSSVIQFAKAT